MDAAVKHTGSKASRMGQGNIQTGQLPPQATLKEMWTKSSNCYRSGRVEDTPK